MNTIKYDPNSILGDADYSAAKLKELSEIQNSDFSRERNKMAYIEKLLDHMHKIKNPRIQSVYKKGFRQGTDDAKDTEDSNNRQGMVKNKRHTSHMLNQIKHGVNPSQYLSQRGSLMKMKSAQSSAIQRNSSNYK
eukprot:CAMPEP_0205806624 /NCGR_PEP_ID=MMETSP0205-20121125/10251_1 /ASSEMBLY_ACC=CAM_ASM_000278 /TAXON_ID=36767 /ORGANISM="Euplotes focardii, Strain TN1" /LENGTH=134 /DNA_ID=CAMNT_0053079835 /DNA_START=596 /DNA_END=997 /DNA_ORIENTATION=-